MAGNQDKYEYPYLGDKRLDLSPEGKHTQIIINELRKRVTASDSKVFQNVDKYREQDRVMTAFMPESALDRNIKNNDERKQLTFVAPMTFAMRETFQTTFLNTFWQSDVGHMYKGIGGPNARVTGALYERCVGRQSSQFQEALHFDTLIGDAITYNRARAMIRWKKERGVEVIKEKLGDLLAMALRLKGHSVNKGKIVDYIDRKILFEGNEITPISIYNTIIDPRCSVSDQKNAEYGGYRWTGNVYQFLDWEEDPSERLFNCEYLKEQTESSDQKCDDWWTGPADQRGGDGRASRDSYQTDGLTLLTVVCRMIPKKWFGEGFPDKPMMMQFTLASGEVVIQAHVLDHWHGDFPWKDLALNDPQLVLGTSHLMTTYAYQQYMSWMMKIKAQFALTNANGKYLVNNDKVNINDFKRTDIGGIIRLKAAAYADDDVRKYIHQLTFPDVTQNYFNDMSQVEQFARNGNGINDAVMGKFQGGDRVTATEVNNAKNQGFSRLWRLARLCDIMFMKPVGFQMAHNTRQWMTEPMFVNLTGERYTQELRRQYNVPRGDAQIMVGPEAFDGLFDVEMRTALNPSTEDTASMVEFLKPMMAAQGVVAQIQQRYDIPNVFASFLEQRGMPMEDFEIQVVPDEVAMAQQQAGNLVPVPGGGQSPVPAQPFMQQ